MRWSWRRTIGYHVSNAPLPCPSKIGGRGYGGTDGKTGALWVEIEKCHGSEKGSSCWPGRPERRTPTTSTPSSSLLVRMYSGTRYREGLICTTSTAGASGLTL